MMCEIARTKQRSPDSQPLPCVRRCRALVHVRHVRYTCRHLMTFAHARHKTYMSNLCPLFQLHSILSYFVIHVVMSWRPLEGRTSDSNDLDNVLKAEVAMVTSWQDDVRSLECRCKMQKGRCLDLFGSIWKRFSKCMVTTATVLWLVLLDIHLETLWMR